MGKLAFIFPGQGSQRIGMGQAMVLAHKNAQEVFNEANEVLRFDLASLCFRGPEDQLQLTMNAQPAILATSVACLRVLEESGLRPDYMAGHSLGEYSALVAAGALSLADAIVTVHKRGLYMEEAVSAGLGAMAAVLHLDKDRLITICNEVSRMDYVVELVNFNCPDQLVISGHKEAVGEVSRLASEAGARKVIPIPVSGPFHSSLMRPAAHRLESILQEMVIQNAKTSVIANVSARPVQHSEEILSALVRQVYSPVLWEDTIRYLFQQGVDTFIEIGNGDILSRLVRKTERGVTAVSVQDPDTLKRTLMLLGGRTC